jgi:uncharacterized protein (TIGR03545 family)
MTRFVQWHFLIPRLLVIVVALLAAQYGLGRLALSTAEESGEAGAGLPVDVKHARVAVFDRQVVLNNLRIEDRSKPAQNWVEADRLVLDVAAAPLVYKQAVIDRGTLSGLRFGRSQADDNGQPADAPLLFNDSAQRRVEEWLKRLGEQFGKNWASQFKSVQLAEELCARWPERSGELERRVKELQHRASDLQQAADAAQTNPLRHAQELHALPSEAATLRKDFAQVGIELENLLETVDTDRRAIVAARQHDEQLLRERLQIETVDAGALTAYLLQRQVTTPLHEALGWLQWTREIAPVGAGPRRAARGEDVLFAGCRPVPRFLIRALELRGTSRLGGRPVELRGMLNDFTRTPALYAKPIRLRLKTTGSPPMELQAIIDRTGAMPRDELKVSGSGILLPALDLGRPDQLGMSLGPAITSFAAHVVVNGESLSGDIQLAQKQVQVVACLQGNLSDVPLAAALNETLRNIDALNVRIALSGTLAEPKCTLWSNIGPVMAEAMELALHRAADDRARNLLARAQRQVDEQLAGLERTATRQHAELISQMSGATGQLERIAGQQSARTRLSHEQLGRRLPTSSLFR